MALFPDRPTSVEARIIANLPLLDVFLAVREPIIGPVLFEEWAPDVTDIVRRRISGLASRGISPNEFVDIVKGSLEFGEKEGAFNLDLPILTSAKLTECLTLIGYGFDSVGDSSTVGERVARQVMKMGFTQEEPECLVLTRTMRLTTQAFMTGYQLSRSTDHPVGIPRNDGLDMFRRVVNGLDN